MKTHTLNLAILATLSPLFSSSLAAEKTAASDELEPVIVTSEKIVNNNSDVTISQQELEKSLSDSPQNLLRNVSGVRFETQGSGSLGAIRIRGMGGATDFNSDRVAVNIDGVPAPSSFVYGHASNNGQNTFDTADLKAVEINKGASAPHVPKSGLAGTVSFVTKDPVDYLREGEDFGGNVRAGYTGQNNMYSGGFSVAGKFSEQFSSMFSYTYRNYHETPNYDGIDTIGRGRQAVNPVDASSHNILTKFVFSPHADHEFKLKLENYKMNFDEQILQRPQAVSNNYYDQFTTKRQSISLQHKFDEKTALFDNGNWQLYYQNSKQNRDNDFISFSSRRGISQAHTKYNVKELGASASFNKTISNHELNYGFQLVNTDVVTRLKYTSPGSVRPYQTQPDTQTKSYKLFIGDDISLADGRFHLMPAVGITKYSIVPKATENYYEALNKTSQTTTTWSIGTTFDINEHHQVFASYRKGLKIPSLLEQNPGAIFAHGLRYEPNPDLRPEESKSAEIGLKSKGRYGSHTISVFHDTYQGFIDVKRIRSGVNKTYNNPNDVIIYGLEYSGTLDLGEVGAIEGLKLKGSLSYAKSREETENGKQPYTNGDPLTGSIGLAYDAPSETWGVEWTTRFAKAKKAKDIAPGDLNPSVWWATPTKPIGGYGVSDLTAYYKPIKNLHINAGVYNVFDKKYAIWSQSINQTYDKVTEPGRSFAVNFRYDF